jgi:hypothetical protein
MESPTTQALGLGTASSLVSQDIDSTKQAKATIAKRDSGMEGILKDLSDQKFDKPPPQLDAKAFQPPTMEDPAKAWGAPTSILALIGSFATRRPLTAALKSATAAINAVKQNNADSFQMAFDQWKADTDFAFKRAGWENDQYKSALDLFNTNFEHGITKLNTLATLNKDTAMLATLQSGNIGDITSLVNARSNLTKSSIEAQKGLEELGQLHEQDAELNQWKKDNPTATLDQRIQKRQEIYAKTPTINGVDSQTVNFAAQQYLLTGQMPGLGMGSASLRTAILQRAAQLAGDPGSHALGQVTKNRAMVEAFSQTALKNADLALSLADKGAGPAGSPMLNRWIQYGRKNVAGDPDVASFDAALTTFKNEYAKIMSGATGAQGSTDSARHEADELISNAFTPEQLRSTIATMTKEMGNRRSSLLEQEQQLQRQISRRGGEGDSSDVGNYINGKIYADASGNKAKYQNGTWIPVP